MQRFTFSTLFEFLATSSGFWVVKSKNTGKKNYETSLVNGRWTIMPKRVRKYFEFLHVTARWSVPANKTNTLRLNTALCLLFVTPAANLFQNSLGCCLLTVL